MLLDISEEERVEKSRSFVERVNKLSREIPGGEVFHDLGVDYDLGNIAPCVGSRVAVWVQTALETTV